MPSYQHVYPSKFLKPIDLTGDTVATIRAVREETLGSGPEANNRLVAYFRGDALKPLPLTRGMAKMIATIVGTDDYLAWGGVRVELFGTVVDAFGETHEVVRLRAPRDQKAAKAAPVVEEDDLDDALQSVTEPPTTTRPASDRAR